MDVVIVATVVVETFLLPLSLFIESAFEFDVGVPVFFVPVSTSAIASANIFAVAPSCFQGGFNSAIVAYVSEGTISAIFLPA